jgi:signal transduction histidine kinase
MLNVIDELLLLAEIRKGQAQTRPLDMAVIVDAALERLAAMVERSQAEIVLPETWPVALGYGPWVEEVWVNYLSNAIKYGGEPPRVELGSDLSQDGGLPEGKARFWVRDNGSGLAKQEQDRLFVPFTRLAQARAQGHGLGLSIVRRIVEKLGGEVGVQSELGEGSLFYFALPLVKDVPGS